MHPLVSLILRVCRAEGVHPNDMSRDRFRELCLEPVTGLKVGSANYIGWNEARRRALVEMRETPANDDASLPIVPEGFALDRVSTLTRNAKGEPQWTIANREKQRAAEALERIAERLNEVVKPRTWTIPRPKSAPAEDLLSVVVFGDPHIGMKAIAAEAGQDWDLAAGIDIHKRAVEELVVTGPATSKCIILDVGDTTHSDNGKRTTTKGTPVDVDGSHADSMSAAYEVLVHAVDCALQRHDEVECVVVPGNHGKETSFAIAMMLKIHYRNEPRVEVPVIRDAAWHSRFGSVLLASTHGDTLRSCKPRDLALTMASRWPHEWAASRWRFWLCGHVHHLTENVVKSGKEVDACVVRTFRTLTPQDAWHNHQGYSAKQDARKIIYHRDKGPRAEFVVTAEFLSVDEAA